MVSSVQATVPLLDSLPKNYPWEVRRPLISPDMGQIVPLLSWLD